MARPTTKTIHQKTTDLTNRQKLDARTNSLAYANRLMKRMALFAIGGDTVNADGDELDDNGNVIKPMSAAQIRAAETVLRKILPDLSSVQELPTDEFDDMSRGEMLDLLGTLVSGNPALLKNPDIQSAVNKSQTVIDIRPKDEMAKDEGPQDEDGNS